MCNKFATILARSSCNARNEIPSILRKFGTQFATNLRKHPPYERPFSKFLIFTLPQKESGNGSLANKWRKSDRSVKKSDQKLLTMQKVIELLLPTSSSGTLRFWIIVRDFLDWSFFWLLRSLGVFLEDLHGDKGDLIGSRTPPSLIWFAIIRKNPHAHKNKIGTSTLL